MRTRDGRAAYFVGYVNPPPKMGPYSYPIRAHVEHPNTPEVWIEWHYMLDGRWKSNDPENGNDLVNVVLT